MKATITFLAILFTAVALCCLASTKAFGQEITREGNTFTQVKTMHQTTDKQTIYIYVIKDVSYPIWITQTGRCYIVRTSRNGKEYRQYLPEQTAKEICAELGIEYKEKQ